MSDSPIMFPFGSRLRPLRTNVMHANALGQVKKNIVTSQYILLCLYVGWVSVAMPPKKRHVGKGKAKATASHTPLLDQENAEAIAPNGH